MAMLVEYNHIMVLICLVDTGVPHVSPLLLSFVGQELSGANRPYTAVLEARPSIRDSAQEESWGRKISRKSSSRWAPKAFPQHFNPASSSLTQPSLTYKER